MVSIDMVQFGQMTDTVFYFLTVEHAVLLGR